jgi:hypothetical protein
MALKLGKLFAKKPGGTLFGNLLKAGANVAGFLGVPGAALVSSMLPTAPAPVIQLGQQLVSQAAFSPVSSGSELRFIAADAKEQILSAGGSAEDASKVGAAVYAASSLPASQAAIVLNSAAASSAGLSSFTAKDAKDILNKAVEGARNGALDGLLETKEGKEMKKAAVNAQGEKYMPWILGSIAGVFAILFFKKK